MKQIWCEDYRSDTVVSLNFGTITERRGSLSTVIMDVINAMGRMGFKGRGEGGLTRTKGRSARGSLTVSKNILPVEPTRTEVCRPFNSP